MSRNTPQARTLYRAVGLCGGVIALANYLGVPAMDLSNWLNGDVPPPVEVYIKAIDLVAGGRAPWGCHSLPDVTS